MAERRPTLDEVLQRLAERDLLTADDVDRAASQATNTAHAARTPWYLQPLIFLGALLAAVLITAGIVSILDLRWTSAPLLALGSIYLAVALVLHRSQSSDFTDHFGLVFSIGAHVLLIAGVVDLAGDTRPEATILLTATALCTALYGVYRDSLHRFLSCSLVFVVAKFALPAEKLGDALHGLVAAMAVACAVVLMRERQLPLWRPLAYACACGLPIVLLPLSERGLWFEDAELPHAWIASIVLGLATLWVLRLAAAHLGVNASVAAQALAVLIVAGLCTLSAPGILAALFLIVLGYAAQHWQLALVGLVALPAFVFKYYYNLELDFMTKSGVLAGSGVLLLLARHASSRGLAAQAGSR